MSGDPSLSSPVRWQSGWQSSTSDVEHLEGIGLDPAFEHSVAFGLASEADGLAPGIGDEAGRARGWRGAISPAGASICREGSGKPWGKKEKIDFA